MFELGHTLDKYSVNRLYTLIHYQNLKSMKNIVLITRNNEVG